VSLWSVLAVLPAPEPTPTETAGPISTVTPAATPSSTAAATPSAAPVETSVPSDSLDVATFQAGIDQLGQWLQVIGVALAIVVALLAIVAVMQVRR
jgi:hypothetical protein